MAWVFAGLVLLLALERLSEPLLAIAQDDTGAQRRLALNLTSALPEACFLLALWWVRQALAELSRGAFHTPMVALALRRVGALLSIGAAIKVLLLPSAQKLLGNAPGYLIAMDVDSFVLCGLGLALSVLAYVLERAASVQAELDEIF